jgi:hypothetical protein
MNLQKLDHMTKQELIDYKAELESISNPIWGKSLAFALYKPVTGYHSPTLNKIAQEMKDHKALIQEIDDTIAEFDQEINCSTCPKCKDGMLLCDNCDYELDFDERPTPKDLSNNEAQSACSCPACDGGLLECESCGYTYDPIQGFLDYHAPMGV